jgi:hypothetical protein
MPAASELEAIVRVVIERLQAIDAARLLPTTATVAVPHPQAAAVNVLVLDRKLVTLADLKGRLDSVQCIQVAARAVVTPAVVDELRKRGIRLERIALSGRSISQPTFAKMLVVTQPNGHSTLAGQLRSSEFSVQPECLELPDTLALFNSHFARGGLAAIWRSPRAYAASHALSALSNVRGVQLARLDDLPQAAEQVNPQILVVDSRNWSSAAVASLAQTWIRSLA